VHVKLLEVWVLCSECRLAVEALQFLHICLYTYVSCVRTVYCVGCLVLKEDLPDCEGSFTAELFALLVCVC